MLVVGAGCAGMRAAIEAYDLGRGRRAPLEDPSGPQPLRRGRGRDQRRARERLRRQPRGARLRHRQGLRLPRRPGRDRDPLQRGARRRLPARALGRGLLAHRGRPDRAAAVRRRGRAADRLCGGHHRATSSIHVLYEQVMKRDLQVYEEFFAWKLVVDDDRCQGVIAWDLLNGGLKTIGAKTVDPRHRRRGPALQRARRTPTPARGTAWRWRCGPGCR